MKYDLVVKINIEGIYTVSAPSLKKAKLKLPDIFDLTGDDLDIDVYSVTLDEETTKEINYQGKKRR